MDILMWLFFISIGFLSVIPVIRLYQYKKLDDYKWLRYFVLTIFSWTILLFLFFLSDQVYFIYYIKFLTYPVVFLVVYFGYETVQSFVKKETNTFTRIFAIVYTLFNLIIVLTNRYHGWFSNIPLDESTTKHDLMFGSIEPLFYFHIIVTYLFALSMIIKLLRHLNRHSKDLNIIPFYSILVSVFIVITINIVHIFFYTFTIDPTYVFFVLIGYLLYIVVFKRDIRYQLLTSSRTLLLDKMREMYIITDHLGNVIEYSRQLVKAFPHLKRHTKSIDSMLEALSRQAIMYTDFEEVKDLPFKKKPYLYMVDKTFIIPNTKFRGRMILLYDETRLFTLIEKINYYMRYDQMTNIYNRNHFENIREHLAKDYPNFGIIMCDVDGLKIMNDYLGHAAGDNLLVRFVKNLITIDSSNQMLFRLGGDEFLIFLRKADEQMIKTMIEEIIEHNDSDNIIDKISVSFGWAIRNPQESFEKVLKRADINLYKMKPQAKAYKEELIAYLNSSKGEQI